MMYDVDVLLFKLRRLLRGGQGVPLFERICLHQIAVGSSRTLQITVRISRGVVPWRAFVIDGQ